MKSLSHQSRCTWQGAFGAGNAEMTEALATAVRSHQALNGMANTLLEVNCYEADRKDLRFYGLLEKSF
ncbi:MAG: hypothetical protein AAFX40_06645 [Cyanobacteria bacterium J06639_1]